MSTCYSTFSTSHPPRCFHKLALGTQSALKLLLLSQCFQSSLRIKTEAIRRWPDHEKLCLSNAFCKPCVVLELEEAISMTWYLNSQKCRCIHYLITWKNIAHQKSIASHCNPFIACEKSITSLKSPHFNPSIPSVSQCQKSEVLLHIFAPRDRPSDKYSATTLLHQPRYLHLSAAPNVPRRRTNGHRDQLAIQIGSLENVAKKKQTWHPGNFIALGIAGMLRRAS